MNEQTMEDIISTLYDMIQDARAVPLAADKCIVERDKVLDMLDEIIAQLPVELKQARTIVESRNELITQARMAQLRKVSNDYMDDALRRTEEAIALSLEDVRDTRAKFAALVDAQEKRAASQDIEV